MNTPTVSTEKCSNFLKHIFDKFQPSDFSIRLWDGSTLAPKTGKASRFTLVLNHPRALKQLLLKPSSKSLGEGFINEDIEVEGDLEAVIQLRDTFTQINLGILEKFQLASHLFSLPSKPNKHKQNQTARLKGAPGSRNRTAKAIQHHYDLPVEFWKLWLDSHLQYTCAYFTSLDQDIEEAQANKLDYLCKKLYLKSGNRLLDIGCGWGELMVHAAKHYGVQALGVTLSPKQAEYVNSIIKEQNLSSHCRVEVCDFRDAKPEFAFDKIVSVGSVEHFGKTMLTDYFRQAWKLLKPGGLFLIQGVSVDPNFTDTPDPSFIQHYVFPDSHLFPISVLLGIAEQNNFEVRDVENLREHYVQTLRHWRKNLENKREKICQTVEDTLYRIFRLYLAGFVPLFESGRFRLIQTLLAKSDCGKTHLPLTREAWYA